MATHVIIGSGPVAHATATELIKHGHTVRSVTRTGNGEMPEGVERVTADASDRSMLIGVTRRAATIYNCVNPLYHRWTQEWPPMARNLLDAAEQHGAVLATMSNLYGYGPSTKPFKETDPLRAPGTKGKVRATMWNEALAAHATGRVRVTEARASDFVGPLVRNAHLGERVVPNILTGKAVAMLGRLDVAHAMTAIGDVGIAMAILGTDERALGRAWHVPTAPAQTTGQNIAALCRAAGVATVKARTMPSSVLKLVGVFSPLMKEMVEVEYQFAKPFDLDSSAFTATFDVKPTPLDETFAATVAWYRTQKA